MRLTHLRLAGFKSFVEPTSVAVPSNLVGVVGPNGCGKSNIIDAVRWVLGESKASELRGESMQDVIFNGSGNRKPASRASVELVFDNSEGRAGGSWNQFAEISVKRILTRDGTSTYYINQQAVRRRDVQDIFLGTGLGPRAYAIIGQGMIARIIEARPEDLRVFLEEAAGVSKYKERRRETANRLQDTRDNLTRVEDILRELSAQIERLEQQAEIARKYKAFLSEKESKQHLLWVIRLNEAVEQKNQASASLEKAKASLEALQSKSISTQTELISARQNQVQAQQKLEAEQTLWIEINRNVSRLEADIRVMAEGKNRLSARLAEIELERQNWISRVSQAKERQSALQEDLSQQEMELEDRLATLDEAELALEPVRSTIDSSRQILDEKRANVVDLQRRIGQLGSRQEAAKSARGSIGSKIERLRLELAGLKTSDDGESEQLRTELEDSRGLIESYSDRLADLEDRLSAENKLLQEADSTLQEESTRFSRLHARHEALLALNEKLSQAGELGAWVEANGLSDSSRLLSALRVERGWEKALESALRESIDAFLVSDIGSTQSLEMSPPPARLAFLSDANSSLLAGASTAPNTLASRVKVDDGDLKAAVSSMLAGCFTAETLSDAIIKQSSLKLGERIFVRAGHWVSFNQVGFYAADNEQAGRLERNQEIDAIATELKAVELLRNEAGSRRDRFRSSVESLKTQSSQMSAQITSLTASSHDLEMELLRLEEAKSRADSRREQLTLDLAILESELEGQEHILAESEESLIQLEDQLQLSNQDLDAKKHEIERIEVELRDLQGALQKAVLAKQDQDYLIRTSKSALLEVSRELQFSETQLNTLASRANDIHQELGGMSLAELEASLQTALGDREIAEESVAICRDELEQIMASVSELELIEKEGEKHAEPLRQAIQECALKIQASDMTIEQYKGNLEEVNADISSIENSLNQMDIAPKASVLQAEVTRLINSMQSLGAVNLAALDELEAASERKGFLDQQAADLTEAMETLEDAIRKIDMETRELLQETFAAVNSQFSRLFPALFGGGEAKLVMTGDEILDAGVQVFAQPPGKKNGTIHLLSGGEKALTATALVFAIFELNPAPFCLLDEVDAPLDDANTERFSKLVRQMSERTQFLFISHNKIAMEMAQQLIGVTMQEKGVSRIVAVDLASAEKLATETV